MIKFDVLSKSRLDILPELCYVCCVMKTIIDQTRREFTARYVADISKAIFAVALASKLFVDLPVWLRLRCQSWDLSSF